MTLLEQIAADIGGAFVRDWTEPATYTPAGGQPRSVPVIYDPVSEVTDIGEMIRMDGIAAGAHVETAAVPELAQGDVMVVRGSTYRVVGVEPDGTGITRVVLGI